MSKTIILSEEKFNRIIKEIEDIDATSNQRPFEGQGEKGGDDTSKYDESIVGEPGDETIYNPNGGVDIENPRL